MKDSPLPDDFRKKDTTGYGHIEGLHPSGARDPDHGMAALPTQAGQALLLIPHDQHQIPLPVKSVNAFWPIRRGPNDPVTVVGEEI
jgi:hypothetical protein